MYKTNFIFVCMLCVYVPILLTMKTRAMYTYNYTIFILIFQIHHHCHWDSFHLLQVIFFLSFFVVYFLNRFATSDLHVYIFDQRSYMFFITMLIRMNEFAIIIITWITIFFSFHFHSLIQYLDFNVFCNSNWKYWIYYTIYACISHIRNKCLNDLSLIEN